MAIFRTKTFSDLYQTIMRRVKLPVTDEEALNACKESINTRYEDISFRKKWRWRRRRWDMNIPSKVEAGTVSVTNGSRVVVGTGTGWTASNVNWYFATGGNDEEYELKTMDVGTQTAYLSTNYVGETNATASYLIYQNELGLVPDCEEIEFVWHDNFRVPLEITSPREIGELMVRFPGAEGWPTHCTVAGFKDYRGPALGEFLLGHDYLGGSDRNDLKLILFPQVPDNDYVLHIDYSVKITPLDADGDEPLIPVEKRHILVYGALADLFSRERADDTSAFWEGKYQDSLKEMEADNEFSDEKPRFVVGGKWWRHKRRMDPSSADLGSYFDRFYRLFD